MNPPVDAPTSRQRRPRTSTRERVERARELHAAARDVRVVGAAHVDRGVVGDERARPCRRALPPTNTSPARTIACARARDGASPRATRS